MAHATAAAAAAAAEAAGPMEELPRRMQTWRLLSLRQTSPEQLFLRKVALKEYGDALLWAQHYRMSTDPVRQAQWLDAPVSKHAISDYLVKVTCTRWVLDECCRRVPDDADMVELLLEYGLRLCKDEIRAARRRAALAPSAAAEAEAAAGGRRRREGRR